MCLGFLGNSFAGDNRRLRRLSDSSIYQAKGSGKYKTDDKKWVRKDTNGISDGFFFWGDWFTSDKKASKWIYSK